MASTVDHSEFVIAKVEAQRSATLIQLAAIVGAALCVAAAAALQGPINKQRKDLQLVMQSDLYSALPPKYAWVSAVGGTFRGIVADVLWMRAENLKQEGKYYESHQLAKWICTLQPRFAAVWRFQAWNMSYNISVATHTTRERWQWVYNGIRLLRDEGIPNNERVVPLYHEMAWIWFHKVGERMDDYHWPYKRIWATYMETLLGHPPLAASDAEQIDWFRPVAEAPHRLEDLIAQHPGVLPIIDGLSAAGVDIGATTSSDRLFHPLEETFFKPYTSYLLQKQSAAYLKKPLEHDKATADLYAVFASAAQPDFEALLAYLRSKVLREQYKMDPQFMLDMTGQLGTDEPIPIDWRTCWAQSLYWAMYGVEQGRKLNSVEEFDLLNTDRIRLFSLGALARQGRVFFRPNLESPENSFLDLTPDWRYVEPVHRMCLKLGKQHAEEGEEVGDTAGEMLRSYHVNTLHSAVVGLYLAGREKEAMKYYDYLVVNYPNQYTGQINDPYREGFHAFVQKQIEDMAGSQHEAILIIHSLLESAYKALANGLGSESAAQINNARVLYDAYMKDRLDDPDARRALPPFDQMAADALGRFVTDPRWPILMRSVVWDRSGIQLKQRIYDDVQHILTEWYGETDLDLARAFPEPPGMTEWRAAHPAETPEDVIEEHQEEKKKAKENQGQ